MLSTLKILSNIYPVKNSPAFISPNSIKRIAKKLNATTSQKAKFNNAPLKVKVLYFKKIKVSIAKNIDININSNKYKFDIFKGII